MRIAIMQPYLIPYAGYFRLMHQADLFVVYDCVQFPRRGWVHRNKISKSDGSTEWLTLPLAKTDRDSTRIMDLQFTDNAQAEWETRLRAFPVVTDNWQHPLVQEISVLKTTPLDTIENSMKVVCETLNISCQLTRSSSLKLPAELKSQDRILSIAKYYGATHYLNAPGGTALYDSETFANHDITLEFLPEYTGSYASILERLITEPADTVQSEVIIG